MNHRSLLVTAALLLFITAIAVQFRKIQISTNTAVCGLRIPNKMPNIPCEKHKFAIVPCGVRSEHDYSIASLRVGI